MTLFYAICYTLVPMHTDEVLASIKDTGYAYARDKSFAFYLGVLGQTSSQWLQEAISAQSSQATLGYDGYEPLQPY